MTFFGNSSTNCNGLRAVVTDDRSIIATEPGTTTDLSSIDVAPTEAQTGSGTLSSGSITEPIDTSSAAATDITSSASPTSTGIVEPPGRSVIFLIQASSNQKRDVEKREAEGFVGADNPDVCTFALTFNLAEGQLFVGGVPTFYAGEDFKVLGNQDRDSFVKGSITRSFGTTGRTLFFKNSGLPNGEAGFCQDSSGQVYITFTASPPGCVPVTLGVYGVTQCQDGRLVGFETSTSALAISTEASTAESVSSGITNMEKPTTAETSVSTEPNPFSSAEPSSALPGTSGSGAFSTASSQIVDTSALASSQIFGSVSSTVSPVSATGTSSTDSSLAISSSVSASGPEASTNTTTIVSTGFVDSTVTTQSSTFSSDSSTEATSSTELEVSSSLTSTSEEPTDTTTVGSVVSTSETFSESATSTAEETTSDQSTTMSESSSEITSTTAETTTADITTTDTTTADTTSDLMTTTTTTAALSECRSDPNPYSDSGSTFDLSCDFSVDSGTSIGVVTANSFNHPPWAAADSVHSLGLQGALSLMSQSSVLELPLELLVMVAVSNFRLRFITPQVYKGGYGLLNPMGRDTAEDRSFMVMPNDDPDYGGFPIAVTPGARTCIAEVKAYWIAEDEDDR
ncbi:hypothetical protein FGADI_6494 [Fusarium gaditjirri]|uniref:DUF7908 domain-containing protein n=1 Tax=Fusarium gaditjirri TaxID=282569 RepID=A0A8H4WWB2_9HYPO|nr:hypothetical protein FGADI_6494 [Fusarium gaditjirri]